MYKIALLCFFNTFLFCMKGYSETLIMKSFFIWEMQLHFQNAVISTVRIYPVTVDTAQKIKINFRFNYINYILGLVKLNSD